MTLVPSDVAGATKEGRAVIGRPRRSQALGELSHRLPSERRDPGTTELWTATKRTSNHHSLRGTEGTFFQSRPNIWPAESSLRWGPLRDRAAPPALGPPVFLADAFGGTAGPREPRGS